MVVSDGGQPSADHHHFGAPARAGQYGELGPGSATSALYSTDSYRFVQIPYKSGL